MKEFEKKNRLDDFYFNHRNVKKHKKLLSILEIILVPSHDEAVIEWGFRWNKSYVRVYMKEEPIISNKIIRDYILANSLQPHTLEIPNKLIVSCSTAHQKYKDNFEEA